MTDSQGRRDVYGNVVSSFRIWWVAAFYIVAMIALGLHLFHGAWSSVRTLGYAKPSGHPLKRRIALVVAIAIWLGFTVVPIGVIAGHHPMKDLKAQEPERAAREEVGEAPLRDEAGESGEQAEIHRHRRGLRARPAASAAASLSELGYQVKCFCFQDSPRRAHSIAAQGGINAAKNYQNDGDSIYRLFYDTIKGGDFRAREATSIASPNSA